MKRAFFIVATALALTAPAAFAQAPKAPVTAAQARTAPASIPAWRAPAPTIRAAAPLARVPFGCDARAPNVCHFRIFYERGDRVVILAAGMKEQKVPVKNGGDYCMTLNKSPAHKCARKALNARYNS